MNWTPPRTSVIVASCYIQDLNISGINKPSPHVFHRALEFGIEQYFDGIRYLDIRPKKTGYGYDISIYRIL